MATALREEMATRGRIKGKEAEEAMNAVITAIRQLESAGDLVLATDDEG
ncbi:MAG TPA: FliG C-terminal domain-containing protein [Paracoccaceae bacterium]